METTKNKIKLLYHGDSPAVATGLGHVSRNLLSGLHKKGVDVTAIGINDRGGYKDPAKYGYKIYPAIYDDYHDVMGVKRLLAMISGQDPEVHDKFDTLLLNYDSYLLDVIKYDGHSILEWLKQMLPKSTIKRTILNTPIDNDWISPSWLEVLQFFDQITVPSQYGLDVIKKYDPKLAKKTKMIYHGINAEEFHPIEENERITMRKMFNANDKFIVGYVGRNQWRKDIYHLMKIFVQFKKKKEKAFLYIHTHPTTIAHDGGNLFQMGDMLGLKLGVDYATPTPEFNENAGFAVEDVNKIYGMMDAFCSASVGEGFGLPYAEAMLAGVPIIAPNNTTVPELLGEGRGLIYETDNTACFGQTDQMRERPLANVSDAADKLFYLSQFRNKEAVDKMKKDAMEFAKKLTPEKMVDSFYDVLTPSPEIIVATH